MKELFDPQRGRDPPVENHWPRWRSLGHGEGAVEGDHASAYNCIPFHICSPLQSE